MEIKDKTRGSSKIQTGQFYRCQAEGYKGEICLLSSVGNGSVIMTFIDGDSWTDPQPVINQQDISTEEFAKVCDGDDFDLMDVKEIVFK